MLNDDFGFLLDALFLFDNKNYEDKVKLSIISDLVLSKFFDNLSLQYKRQIIFNQITKNTILNEFSFKKFFLNHYNLQENKNCENVLKIIDIIHKFVRRRELTDDELNFAKKINKKYKIFNETFDEMNIELKNEFTSKLLNYEIKSENFYYTIIDGVTLKLVTKFVQEGKKSCSAYHSWLGFSTILPDFYNPNLNEIKGIDFLKENLLYKIEKFLKEN